MAEVAQLQQAGTLADRINAEHEACLKAVESALSHAIEAGRLLTEAKAGVPHGAWLPWLADNFEGSERTASGYIRLYRNREELSQIGNTAADLSLREALKALAAPRDQAREREAQLRARERAEQKLRDRAEVAIRTGNHDLPADLDATPGRWEQARWEAVQTRQQNIPNVIEALGYELHILVKHAPPDKVGRYLIEQGGSDLADLRAGAAWLQQVLAEAERAQ